MLTGTSGSAGAALFFARGSAGFAFATMRAGFSGARLSLPVLGAAGAAFTGAGLVGAGRQEKCRSEYYGVKGNGFSHGSPLKGVD